jgi:hypothetical protein
MKYRIIGQIESNLTRGQIDKILDAFGFYMYSIEYEDMPKFLITPIKEKSEEVK